MKIIVHSPEPAMWHPFALLRRMAAESWRFRELVRRLIVRDMRAQYRQSLLGYVWAFIPPIATAAGFSLARESGVLRIADTTIPYVVFVMVGTVLWQTFIEALNGPIEALTNFKGVLNRVYLPPEIIIIGKMGEVAVNLSIRLLLLAIVFALYEVPITPMILFAFLLLSLLILEATAIGLILAPVAALYHDISKGLPVVTGFWFLLTPVAYPIPESGTFALIVKANPATYFIATIRNLATGGPMPDMFSLVLVSLVSVAAFGFALIVFRISMPFVIERASA